MKKQTKKQMELQNAMKVLVRSLRKDSGYRIAWQANIAMSFYDAHCQQGGRTSRAKIHSIANSAADHFLKLLCNEYKYPVRKRK